VKVLIDTQLPIALARWMSSQGADAHHVLDATVGLQQAGRFSLIWPAIHQAFDSGQRIVEVR